MMSNVRDREPDGFGGGVLAGGAGGRCDGGPGAGAIGGPEPTPGGPTGGGYGLLTACTVTMRPAQWPAAPARSPGRYEADDPRADSSVSSTPAA